MMITLGLLALVTFGTLAALVSTGSFGAMMTSPERPWFPRGLVPAGNAIAEELFHPTSAFVWPDRFKKWGPVRFEGEGPARKAIIGPIQDAEDCENLVRLFAQPRFAEATDLSIYDATMEIWTFRYRQAAIYYRDLGPHGTYTPTPCEVLDADQRVLTLRKKNQPRAPTGLG